VRTDFAQLRRLPDLLFPRRCPFCGSLLGPDALQGTVCPACVPEEMHLQHIPARLPEGEHDFYAVREAAAAYYYEDIVRTAVLRCKRGGCFWYARELADRVAVLVFGALPAKQPGKMPQYAGVTALPLYSCIVPVPPRQPLPVAVGRQHAHFEKIGVLAYDVERLHADRTGRTQYCQSLFHADLLEDDISFGIDGLAVVPEFEFEESHLALLGFGVVADQLARTDGLPFGHQRLRESLVDR